MTKRQFNIANIYGFDSLLHSMIPFHNNSIKECWGSKLENYEASKEEIKFTFLNNGDKYGVILKSQNERGDFKGRIIRDGEHVGFGYYRVFESYDRTILWGDWNENEFPWVSLIEVFWNVV